MDGEKTEERKEMAGGGRPARRFRLWWIMLIAVCLLAAGVYLFVVRPGASKPGGRQGQPGQGRAVPVVAAASRTGDFGVYVNGLGTVTPVYTVTVRTRVDGQLMEIYYKEGQMVKQGDLVAPHRPEAFSSTACPGGRADGPGSGLPGKCPH